MPAIHLPALPTPALITMPFPLNLSIAVPLSHPPQAGGPRMPRLLPPPQHPSAEQGGLQPLSAPLLRRLQGRAQQRRCGGGGGGGGMALDNGPVPGRDPVCWLAAGASICYSHLNASSAACHLCPTPSAPLLQWLQTC